MAAPTATSPTTLCRDHRRAMVATVPSLVVPTIVGFIVGSIWPSTAGPALTVVLTLAGWNLFAVVYVILTLRIFRPVGKDEFVHRMAVRGTSRSRLTRRLHGDGPTFTIESAIVAFGVVLTVPHIEAIQVDDWLLVPLTLTTLLASWALSVVSYALHYAEQDLAEPSLEYPGDRTNAFPDYLYFSIAVATTFGATDVNITKPQMRRVVNLHTILTFVYNSVIVALLASLLIR